VSGTVFEIVAQRPVPIQSRVSFEYRKPNESFSTGGMVSADDGSFVLEHVSSGTALTLRAAASIGSWREQPCGVNTLVRSDTRLDIELVQTGTTGVTTGSPVLSGLVYEMTPAGRRPIADADVAYVSGCSGLAEVYARTDGQGRYSFCRLPSGPGCVIAGLERYGGRWFAERQIGTNIQGDAVLDIELVGGEPPPSIRSVIASSLRTALR
jgi:hypothetical protein